MTVFLDTSPLFKLYFQEEGSAGIDAFFAERRISRLSISALTGIGLRSIIWRKVRTKEVSLADAHAIIRVLTNGLPSHTIVASGDAITQLASQLIDKHGLNGLRSLYALQL